MIETIILNYLKLKMNLEVQMEDKKKHGEYILIEKTGSGEENHIKKAVIAIQSFADSLYRAAEINEEVKKTMKEIVELEDISKCDLNTDYNYTDVARKKYRYQAVFDITHY
nr:MAG TPA: tail completion protein [Caudoviricetes sp.]